MLDNFLKTDYILIKQKKIMAKYWCESLGQLTKSELAIRNLNQTLPIYSNVINKTSDFYLPNYYTHSSTI